MAKPRIHVAVVQLELRELRPPNRVCGHLAVDVRPEQHEHVRDCRNESFERLFLRPFLRVRDEAIVDRRPDLVHLGAWEIRCGYIPHS